MTTLAYLASSPSAEQRERMFFLAMAVALAVTVVVGFSLFLVAGISSFSVPWWVHVHAVSFMAWIVLYVVQNLLVLNNALSIHRRLGIYGAGLAAWMVVVGLVLTPVTLAVNRSPPFFTPPFFLALDWLNILIFAALILAGLHNRKRSDWHRRLMLCATICVVAPAWGRMLVIFSGTMQLWLLTTILLTYVAVAMCADWRIRGRVHPAYFWGGGALIGMAAAIELLAIFPPFVALAGSITG